jgi:hypothetical protein
LNSEKAESNTQDPSSGAADSNSKTRFHVPKPVWLVIEDPTICKMIQ